ncbi:hypothetical protein [Psychroserpens jangbogonensis]|uniref:hypothetical protein n=1 Tax=Psychroserpens jangbogonensis TaxID=1484460 RepID=UPI00053DBD21|nr:hypothetical protein [Psychroserpens jangbogonensis]
MRKFTFLIIVFLIVSFNSSFAQTGLPTQEAAMVGEIAPADFKNYEGTVLVMPAFKARGTKKWLTKQFDKNYGKPFYIADVSDVTTGYGDDKYPIETYKYMIFIQSSKSFSGNTEYSFQLVDRSTNTVYYHPSSGNMVKKYLKKLMK